VVRLLDLNGRGIATLSDGLANVGGNPIPVAAAFRQRAPARDAGGGAEWIASRILNSI